MSFSFVLPFSAFAPTFFVMLPVVTLRLAILTFTSDEKGWCGRGHCCLNSVWVLGLMGHTALFFWLKLLGVGGGWGCGVWVFPFFLIPESPFFRAHLLQWGQWQIAFRGTFQASIALPVRFLVLMVEKHLCLGFYLVLMTCLVIFHHYQ